MATGTGAVSLASTAGMTVQAATATISGLVSLAAITGMTVQVTLAGPMPTLAEQIAAVAGEDPIFLGATGYVDTVFTSRLASDTE